VDLCSLINTALFQFNTVFASVNGSR